MDSRVRGATAIPRMIATTVGAFRGLLRAEVRLLVQEASAFAGEKARSIGMLVFGAILGFIALVFLALGAAAGLANVLPAWAAALIVAGGLLLIAALLAYVGIRGLKKKFTAPAQMADRIKEDLRWAANGSH
jgi:Putative Actinobacterial Holin-X, holin superfamily III